MFDFAWSELALIAVVALVVIGPKDLPRAMRILGMWVRKARSVAHEFQSSVEQMMREAELEDVRQQVDKATRFNVEEEIARHVDPGGELRSTFSDPMLKDPLRETAAAVPPPESAPGAGVLLEAERPPEPQRTPDAPEALPADIGADPRAR